MSLLSENASPASPSMARSVIKLIRRRPILVICPAIVLLFLLYIKGLAHNPLGFFVDESGIAYNAYLIAHSGRGESGQLFPLYFQFFSGGWTQWANPTQIYLLAIPFRLFRPTIWLARANSALW